ncbi:MAG: pantetheine-phosphate adenylyltransferase [Pseudomonadota bacterium]
MRIGLYPGTFDPITLGHIDIIQRAMAMVDRLVIGVAINRDKAPLFGLEERVFMVQEECRDIAARVGGEIIVHPFENLLIDCARDVGAGIIIRGLRAVADFEYEFQMVGMNRALDASIETVFLMADARRQAIASKLVKEICRLGGDVSKFVTPAVDAALVRRLRRKG